MDRTTVEAIRARLARIKVAITAKRTRELQANIIEAAYLRREPKGGGKT